MADKFIEAVRAALHPERIAHVSPRTIVNVGDGDGAAAAPAQHAPKPKPAPRKRAAKKAAPRTAASQPTAQTDDDGGRPAAPALAATQPAPRKRAARRAAPRAAASQPTSQTDDECGGPAAPATQPAPRKRAAPTGSAGSNGSSAPSKRTRSDKTARGARYRTHPSQPVLDRLYRSNHHRLYVVSRAGCAEAPTFAVMGTNGNVYHCAVSEAPACDCPDFRKRLDSPAHGPCKHLIFVFLRVLKVARDNPAWWQVRLLPDEVCDIVANAPDMARLDCVAERAAVEQYERSRPPTASRPASQQQQQPDQTADGDCPVCFEDMAKDAHKAENAVTSCPSCRQFFHRQCLKRWATAQASGHADPTCPLCRAQMPAEQSGAASTGGADEQEYMNLAQFSSTHSQPLTLAELYADTHQYIGRGGGRGRGRGGRGRRRGA